ERGREEGVAVRGHLEAGPGRERADGAADRVQPVPWVQVVEPGGQRRRPVHGLPDGPGGGPGRGRAGHLPLRLRQGRPEVAAPGAAMTWTQTYDPLGSDLLSPLAAAVP